ncbi:hypothetical protein ACWGA4_12080 [Streptomyces rubiginosohelvolus]|uniref:hypothetical protein n=1 Tax=Streptomyces sp. CB02130 TaxID=1703934 RepID=UPI001160F1AE|nr:hypothetical protein [Streptomyces sp. CB02130]
MYAGRETVDGCLAPGHDARGRSVRTGTGRDVQAQIDDLVDAVGRLPGHINVLIEQVGTLVEQAGRPAEEDPNVRKDRAYHRFLTALPELELMPVEWLRVLGAPPNGLPPAEPAYYDDDARKKLAAIAELVSKQNCLPELMVLVSHPGLVPATRSPVNAPSPELVRKADVDLYFAELREALEGYFAELRGEERPPVAGDRSPASPQ